MALLSRFGGTAGRGAGAGMVEQPQLTAVDVLKHHSAHLQRSANLLLAKEAAARQRLEAFALGRPLTARLGERHVELGAEQPLEQYRHRDIVAESQAVVSQLHEQLVEDDRFLLRQVGLALRIAALPELEPEPEPRPEQAERSLFPASSLPPSLEAIANQQYQRSASTAQWAMAPLPVLQFPPGGDAPGAHRSALTGYEATLAAARDRVAENAAQQARLAKAREISLAAATERGQALAALSFEQDVATELAASSLRLERGLEEERAENEVSVLFWGVGELGLRIRRRNLAFAQRSVDMASTRAELDGSDLSNGDFEFLSHAERVHERLTLHAAVDPLAPQKYEDTAAWLRMVGVQTQDEMNAGKLVTGGPAAFRPVAADGFAAVFHLSPMPDASGRGLGESVRAPCQSPRSLATHLSVS